MQRKKLIIILSIVGAVVALSVLGFVWQKQANKPKYETFAVKRGNLQQEVSATGEVKPAQDVSLGFETSGKVSSIAAVGSEVKKGQTVTRLNASDLQAQLTQAQAGLEKEIAVLNKLLIGSSVQELAVYETKVANAKTALQDKQTDLAEVQNKAVVDLANDYDSAKDSLLSAYTTADDALNKQIDDLFLNDNTSSPILTFSTNNNQQAQNTEDQRVMAGSALSALKTIAENLPQSQSQTDSILTKTESNLAIIGNFLNQLAGTLNNAVGLSSATLTTYKGYVNTARTNIDTALSALNTAKQNIASQKATNQSAIATAQAAVHTAQSAFDLAEKELALKKAPATQEDIQQQEAQVKAASANVVNLQAKIEKTVLRSPFDGVITKQDAKVGENITAGVVLVKIATQNQLEVETLISEVDIAKIKAGQTAKITLDAFSDEIVFDSEVIFVEPSQTVIQDVVYYKARLAFAQENPDIKQGMTADVSILTAQKENVLYVPSRAVKSSNGDKYIEVLVSGKPEKRLVETGIRGNEGIEIISGINEGDLVITFVNTK